MKRRSNNDESLTEERNDHLTSHLDDQMETFTILSEKTIKDLQTVIWNLQRASARSCGTSISGQTLQDFLHYWLRERKATFGVSAYVSYRTCVTKHVLPLLGEIPLRSLSREQLQRFYYEQHGRVSPNMLRLIQKILGWALTDAVRWKRRATNPHTGMEPPGPMRKEEKLYDKH